MIPLVLNATSDAERPFVTRLRTKQSGLDGQDDTVLIDTSGNESIFAGPFGLLSVTGAAPDALDGDVLLVIPGRGKAERLIRANSPHNTLLITERCDQLCVMCSQPPKKTHDDRFELLEAACLLAPQGLLLGISGGEPTLYKEQLLALLERVLARRPDLQFHVLSNAQHFENVDIERLASPRFKRVSWGIPLYAASAVLHDDIVGKAGAFTLLEAGLGRLAMAGARVELRTVLLSENVAQLPTLSRYVAARLQFIEAWSIMQLEHIGFAKGRWSELFVDHRNNFAPIADALNQALLHGVRAQMFNFPRCTVPPEYRHLAIASISDWKRKYAPACTSCTEQVQCSGFFEWHPNEEAHMVVNPL